MADAGLSNEINKRRTFAIISHPDAGKNTITEKVLLFGNALQVAGTVKGKKSGQHAKSDERRGLIQRDMENSYLNLPVDDEDSLLHLQGASVSYRVAIGPNQGQKVFTLQTVPQST